jgi:hypothetical protein
MKDDILPPSVRIKLTPDQEQISAEITRLLGGRSEYPRTVVLDRVRYCIDTLARGLPIAKGFFDRRKNKAHANKLIEAIDTLKQLIETAPEGLAWSFCLHPEDRFHVQLDTIRKVCTRQSEWHRGLIGFDFGYHHRFDLVGEWCAQFAAKLMEEIAPGARISSADRTSLFRRVAGLLQGAVTGRDLKSAREVDIERACDRVVKKRRQ